MKRWEPLNERQLDLLKRVDAAEDLSGPAHNRLRHSANAVRDRGLITISKRGGRWQAEMTEAGRFYLDHGYHPDDPRHADKRSQTQTTASDAAPTPRGTAPRTPTVRDPDRVSSETPRRSAPQATIEAAEQRRAEAIDLVERLGTDKLVVVKAPSDDEIVRWRKVVDFAKRHDLVPEGHRIEKIRQWNRDRDLHIRLIKGSHANTRHDKTDLPSVPVPETLRSPHPVVARLRDDKARLVMPTDLRRRCLLILQGLAGEAARRGHKITDQPVSQHRQYQYYEYGTRSDGPRYSRREGELNIVVDGFSCTVTIQQVSPQSSDPDKTERLVVELPAYRSEGRQCRWADGKVRTVEDGLAALLHEVEVRAVEDRQREIDEARAKAERQVKWEQAMHVAQQQAVEAHYAKILDRQVGRWRRANELRTYREALKQRLANPRPDDGNLAGAREWLAWIDRHIAGTDPAETPPAMPDPPELTHDDLKPYLKGWSPYGPEAHLNSWQRR
ncbi:hypothetical protein [Amycolatopsis circi]|uniref:hypothetical protein n=1 Tax=Amycolatopsis circi TaxID=871959 RepID=UPI000E23388D|nr:hypothetical protein [Amycolatopsis circi]